MLSASFAAMLSAYGNATADVAAKVDPEQRTVDMIAWSITVPFAVLAAVMVLMSCSSKFCSLVCMEPPDLSLKGVPATGKAAPAVAQAETQPSSTAAAAAAQQPLPRLWRVGDGFYDLTEFIPKHPGGGLVLEQTVGTEISALFHSHHLTEKPAKILESYRVAKVSPEDAAAIPACDYSFAKDGFFQTLKRRVIAMNIHAPTQVTWGYKFKVCVALAAFAVSWAACCLMPMDATWGRMVVALALLNAWLRMCITGIGHEAIHGRNQNRFTFELFDMMMIFPSEEWHKEHVVQHHPHTKRFDMDPDEILDPFRLCNSVPWQLHHVVQAPLQLVLVLASVIIYVDKRVVNAQFPIRGAAYLLAFHLLPLFTRASTSEALWLMLFSGGFAQLITIFCFHLSHINESNALHADFQFGTDWGAHQLCTSSNFLGRAAALFSITGMLEMQIEHHLFPGLSYRNQKKIVPLVQLTAKEFGLPYYQFPSAIHGMAAHLYTLHKNGWMPAAA